MCKDDLIRICRKDLGKQRWAPRSGGSWKGLRGSMLLGGFGRTSFFAEKQAVVLCFGEAYTKVGLAGATRVSSDRAQSAKESRPRAIFHSPELRQRHLATEVSTSLSEAEWRQLLTDLMNRSPT